MRTARGFTLVEMLVALAVSAIAIAAAVVAANAQERASHAGHRLRAAQGAAREALLILERRLPMAGYGMDAPLALDLQWYKPGLVGTCPPELSPCAPDSLTDSDEITVYARNPAYWVTKAFGQAVTAEPRGKAWSVLALHGDTLTLRAHAGDQFRRGQILQLVCAGELDYAYFTVDVTAPTPAPVTDEGTELDVKLQAVSASDPFKRQDVAATLDCMGDPGVTLNAKPNAKAFQIERYRFHVRPVSLGNLKYQPYLMLDQGVDTDLDGDVDADDELYLVEGIESLQVAYVFAEPTLKVAGDVPGSPVSFATGDPGITGQTVTATRFQSPTELAAGKNDYDYSSFYSHSTLTPPPARKTNAQANVRRLLVSVVARSPEPDPTGMANLSYASSNQLYRLNQNAAPAWITGYVAGAARGGDDGYQRAVVESGIALPNMLIRSMSYF